jgi:hypothetical protein
MEELALDRPATSSPIRLAAAGFVSALISIPFKDQSLMLGGAIFGAVLALYFAFFEGVRSPVKLIVFPMVCGAAYPLAILVVAFSHLGWSAQSVDFTLGQYLVGGGVGAFIVLLAGMLLFGPAEMRGDALGLAFFGALGGGILSLLGGELDRATGPHRAGDFGASVSFVWQSGVALILGLLLRWGQKRYLSAPRTPT